jgi:hypothetical protein
LQRPQQHTGSHELSHQPIQKKEQPFFGGAGNAMSFFQPEHGSRSAPGTNSPGNTTPMHQAAGNHFFSSTATNILQRKCTDCAKEEKEEINPKPIDTAAITGIIQKQEAGSSATPTLPITTEFDEEDDTPEVRALLARRHQRITTAIRLLTEAATRHDAAGLMARARTMDRDIVMSVIHHPDFLNLVRNQLNPVSGWIIYRILLEREYGERFPQELLRQLTRAISAHDAVNTFRLLRVIIPSFWGYGVLPVLENIIDRAFTGDALHDEMVAAIRAGQVSGRPIAVNAVSQLAGAVHYDHANEAAAGHNSLIRYNNLESYNWYISSGELRVIVIIKMVDAEHPDQPYYLPDRVITRWIDGINSAWNNLYMVTNSLNSYRLVFAPAFVYNHSRPNHTLHIGHGTIAGNCDFMNRENEHCWYASTTGATAAHEFGHMLGNPDEYQLAERAADLPASLTTDMTQGDIEANTAEGLRASGVTMNADPAGGFTAESLMGRNTRNSVAAPRHVQRVVNQLNFSIIQTGEALYHVESR